MNIMFVRRMDEAGKLRRRKLWIEVGGLDSNGFVGDHVSSIPPRVLKVGDEVIVRVVSRKDADEPKRTRRPSRRRAVGWLREDFAHFERQLAELRAR